MMLEKIRKTVKIKDLGEVITGTTPPTQHQEYFGGQYIFIKPSDISTEQRYVFRTEMTLSNEGCDYQKRKLLPKNSICVVCIGTIGKMCLTSKPSFTNQQLNSIIVDQSQYEPIYVYYLMKTYITHVKHLNAGSASGRENVNKSSFENLEIEVHELATQRKIAAILSAYDDLIENNTRRIEILEEMARSLYHQWFVNFRFPGHEKVKMVDSELGLVPEGWEVKTIGDACLVGDGAHAKIKRQTSGVLYLTCKNLKEGGLDLSKVDYISEEDYNKYFRENSKALTKLKADDVIFSIIGTIGEPYLVKPKDYFGISSSVAILRPNKSVLSTNYLYYWVKSHIFQNALYGIKGGVAQGYVSLEMIKSLPLYYPELSMQNQFDAHASSILSLIEVLTQKNANLRQTRDLLLPKLISGEIDVENLDINAGEVAA